LFRIGTTDCEVVEAYRFNREFICIRGSQFFVNGEIVFSRADLPHRDMIYRSVFGPAPSHNARIFGDTNVNKRFGARRLTGERKPEQPGLHRQLFQNQNTSILNAKSLFDLLQSKMASDFNTFTTTEQECKEHYQDPHDKKALRIQAFNDLFDSGELFDRYHVWLRGSRVIWKLKRDEYAKPGKKPRMIVDLGVSASLRGFRLLEVLKRSMSSDVLEFNGGEFYFCKSPDPTTLQWVFERLINPPKRFFYVYFSDDSCFSVRDNGLVKMFNLDISSCDASHGPEIFKLLTMMVPERLRGEMTLLVKQCMADLVVTSSDDCMEKVILQPLVPKLYSGSTITTFINNLANLLIGYELSLLSTYTPQLMENAASRAGYLITGCTPLNKPQELQFLKHSPVIDTTGKWQPLLNIGVMLRASGSCRGDLPGRGDWRVRAKAFQSALLRGCYPHATFTLLENMKSSSATSLVFDQSVLGHDFDYKIGYAPYHTFSVSSDELYKRYSLTPFQIHTVDNIFGNMQVGEYLHDSSLSIILNLDYGLSTVAYSSANHKLDFDSTFSF
jgi:hypothetical protein